MAKANWKVLKGQKNNIHINCQFIIRTLKWKGIKCTWITRTIVIFSSQISGRFSSLSPPGGGGAKITRDFLQPDPGFGWPAETSCYNLLVLIGNRSDAGGEGGGKGRYRGAYIILRVKGLFPKTQIVAATSGRNTAIYLTQWICKREFYIWKIPLMIAKSRVI